MLALLVTAGVSCSNDLERVDIVDHKGWRTLGTLKNGKKHGQWLRLDGQGRKWELETWRNGVQHGLEMRWYENGQLWSDARMVHGVTHGRFRVFRDNGQLAELGWAHKEIMIGLWCVWGEDGRVSKITEYFDGRIVREDEAPEGPCPLTAGVGNKHRDPANADYD